METTAINASLDTHRERANKDGFSTWYVQVYGRRRKIVLQEFRGRLYLVGQLIANQMVVIPFETPLSKIVKFFGPVTAKG